MRAASARSCCVQSWRRTEWLRPRDPRVVDLDQSRPQIFGDVPRPVMAPHLAQVGDVADVVPGSGLIEVFIFHRLSRDIARQLECLQDRDRIGPTAADVVNLGYPGLLDKGLDETRNVETMNVVADLLSLVAENLVGAPLNVAA